MTSPLSMYFNLQKLMVTFSEHTTDCCNHFFSNTLFYSYVGFSLSSPPVHFIFFWFYLNLSFPLLCICLPIFELPWFLFSMPFPKNPKPLPPLHLGFLDLISKSNLLISPVVQSQAVGKLFNLPSPVIGTSKSDRHLPVHLNKILSLL